jgi:hypothetical protein
MAAAAGTAYRWTDANGQVHYSQTPPTGGNYEPVKPAIAPPPQKDPAAGQDKKEKEPEPDSVGAIQKYVEEAEAARTAQAEEKAKAEVARAESERACTEWRTRLAFLDQRSPRRLAVMNADGSVTRMKVEQFEARRAEAAQQVEQHCS